MRFIRQLSSIAAITLAAFALQPAHAAEQPYPSKSIRLVVPYTAGGSSDFVARQMAQAMTAGLGQTVVVDDKVDLRAVVPAFMISEIRRGFEIGFLIMLPFLVIDLIVATITMAMGMMMLPPTAISLPFKILFFVLIDGWNLLVGSLVRSFS